MLVGLALVACSGGADSGDTCAAGETRTCTCSSGAVGERTCNEDGSAWGGCICGDLVTPDVIDDGTGVDDTTLSETTPTKGDLEAILHDGTGGAFVFSQIVVRLVNGTTLCSTLAPAKVPAGVLAQKTLVSTGTSALFENLVAAKTYTIVASGKGPNGHLAGWGCKDGVAITGGQSTQQSVVLELQPLDTAVCFNTTLQVAFGGSAQSVSVDVRDTVADALIGADAALRDGVVQRLHDAHQADWGAASGSMSDGFGDEIDEVLPEWLAAHPRTWLDCYLAADDALATIAATVAAGLRLKLSATADGALTGEETWQSATVYWNGACQAGGVCAGVPAVQGCTKQGTQCGCSLPLADVAVGSAASFSGTLPAWDALDVAAHPVPLKHGRLARRVVPLLLKGASGGLVDSVAEAYGALWDCAALAAALSPTLYQISGVEQAEVVTHCQATAVALAAALDEALAPEADESLSIEGSAVLLDQNDDLKVDRLLDGVLTGEIAWGDEVRGTFDGTFAGTAVNCP
jgi:hypothetical protein